MRYETTLGRAALALLAGAAAGAAITTVLHLGLILRPNRTWTDATERAAAMSLLYFILFTAGLLALAAPAWWLLHRLGRRGQVQALILGVTLTLVSYLAYSQYTWHFTRKLFYGPAPIFWASGLGRGLRGWLPYRLTLLEGAVWYSIAGGLVGLLIWRIAYRPSRSEMGS
jgi:hypothetical protein